VHSAKIPSKVFLIGEYVALVGRPVIVAGVEPCFEVEPREGEALEFHPDSPAGKLLSTGLKTQSFEMRDPHHGAGGFGGSTAEYLSLHLSRTEGELPKWENVFDEYRELTAKGPLPPSGADLIAQMLGGIHLIDGTHRKASPIFPRGGKLCLVFAASHLPGRKVKTHEHLEELAETWNPKALIPLLELPLKEGRKALESDGFGAFGDFAREYAEILWNAGLESPAAHADREALEALPRVNGVKGTGALLSDGVLVFMDELHTADDRARVIEAAQERGLKLVLDGIKPVRGPWNLEDTHG
jgi:hypothetical protein